MKKLVALASLSAALAVAGAAGAQESAFARGPLPAPENAFEGAISLGYTQPFGLVRTGQNIHDVAGPLGAAELGLGYRISPAFGIQASGQYSQGESFVNGTSKSRGLVGGIDASYHFMPYERLDPFIQAGVGYRFLWTVGDVDTPTVLDHGFRFFRGVVGLDLRNRADVAIAPVVGADLNMFLWERVGGGPDGNIANPRLNTFIFAAVQGRFDVGNAVAPAAEVARR